VVPYGDSKCLTERRGYGVACGREAQIITVVAVGQPNRGNRLALVDVALVLHGGMSAVNKPWLSSLAVFDNAIKLL